MQPDVPPLRFEGIIGFATADREEAVHFFEHTLGLARSGEEGALLFYPLGHDLSVTVDTAGASAGDPPYLLFSAADLVGAGEHFLQSGCAIRPLPWAPEAPGFLARSPEGHTVCVVDAAALGDE
jgi:hypothetical protein